MLTSKQQSKVTTEVVLNALEQMVTEDLEAVISKARIVRAEHFMPHLSIEEEKLFARIYTSFSSDLRKRYNQLNKLCSAEKLSDAEHQELIALSDDLEIKHADRLNALIELSQLRDTTLPSLLESLGVPLRLP